MAIAFSGILFRWADVSPATGTVFRALYGLPVLGLFAWAEFRRFGPLSARGTRLALLAGAFFTADLMFWHHAIEAVGAGLATVLGNLQVLVVGLVAWFIFGERPPRAAVVALPVVLVGVALISGVVGGGAYGSNPPLGVALGLLTAVAYAGYLLVIRVVAKDAHGPASPVFLATASTAICGIVVGALLGELDLVPSWPSHGYLALLGLTSQAAGSLLISVSLPRLPAVLTSIILLSQPVATVFLAIILLGEAPSALQLGGVALVIVGVAVGSGVVERLRAARAGSSRAASNPAERTAAGPTGEVG